MASTCRLYSGDEQKRIAEDTIADVNASGLWPGKVVTEVAPAGPFWEAEPSIRTIWNVSRRLHLPLRPAPLEIAASGRGEGQLADRARRGASSVAASVRPLFPFVLVVSPPAISYANSAMARRAGSADLPLHGGLFQSGSPTG